MRSAVASLAGEAVALLHKDVPVAVGQHRAERMVAGLAGPAGDVEGLAQQRFVVGAGGGHVGFFLSATAAPDRALPYIPDGWKLPERGTGVDDQSGGASGASGRRLPITNSGDRATAGRPTGCPELISSAYFLCILPARFPRIAVVLFI